MSYSVFQLWSLSKFLIPSKEKIKTPYQLYKEEKKKEEEIAQRELKEEKKQIEKEKEKERKRLLKLVEDETIFSMTHLVQVSKPLTEKTTLCITDGEFTSRGLEIKAYVSYDNKDGEIFTIRVKIREDNTLENISNNKENSIKEAEFEYMGKIFILTAEEIDKICDKKDYSEIREECLKKVLKIESLLDSQYR